MNEVRLDVVQQALVVSDHDDGVLGVAQQVDAFGHDTQGIDVQARICLIQNGQLWLQQRHLEDLVAFLFAAGETGVDAALQQLVVEFHGGRFLAYQFHESHSVQFFFSPDFADGVEGFAQESHVVDAGEFHRILHGEEDPCPGTFFGFHFQQVAALEKDFTARDFITLAPGKDIGEGALARTVGAHDGMDFAFTHFQVQALENFLAAHVDVQVINAKHYIIAPKYWYYLVNVGRTSVRQTTGSW